MLRRSIKSFALVLFLLLQSQTLPSSATIAFTDQAGDKLSPKGQQAFNKGVAAADKKDWAEVIKQFSAAQEADPFSPGVLFNLGIVHAKAGHELAAIAWLESYLAAEPDALNAKAVRNEIARLENAVRGRIAQIMKAAFEAAQTIPPQSRTQPVSFIAMVQASMGDTKGARSTLESVGVAFGLRHWGMYGEYCGREGNFEETKKAFTEAFAEVYKGPLQDRAQVERQAIEGAWERIIDFFRAVPDAKMAVKAAEMKDRDNLFDSAAISTTFRREEAQAGSPKAVWTIYARDLSERNEVVNLDKALEEAASEPEAGKFPMSIAAVAANLYQHLQMIHAKQRRWSTQKVASAP